MRRIAIWFFLLNKRLFKKGSFLMILCAVPLLVAGMRLAARQESGIVTIALCRTDPSDELSAEIVDGLLDDGNVLRYVVCETPEEARDLVERFQADAAWIFPENLALRLGESAARKRVRPVVTVVEREDSIPLAFSREILTSALYPFFSYAVYEDYVRDDLGLAAEDEELSKAYERLKADGTLFQVVYFDGSATEKSSYLLAPLRGILALWLVLCGFAASLYYMQDERRGTFSWMPIKHRLWLAFGFHGVVLADAAAALLIACRLSGVFTVWYREVIHAALFTGCVLVFCNLVRLLCGTPERLGCCIPILLMGMAAVCPVFINVDRFRPLQYLLPPFYYLKATHSTYHGYLMAAYLLVGTGLCVLVSGWKNALHK